jgi:LysM repeat protein
VQTEEDCVRNRVFSDFNMRFFILMLLFFQFAVLPLASQQRSSIFDRYIKQYSHLAMQEEKKHRIPASITLAQALLESGAGQSQLAQATNNHFGIKCRNDWTGARYHKDAEVPNECFRKYRSVKDSYADHSLFLKHDRYASLFKLRMTDYSKWAKGLQDCKYATDRKYAIKLISLIETYKLYDYVGKDLKDVVAQDEADGEWRSHPVGKIYGLRYVVANSGDSFASLAMELNMKAKDLAKFNEAPVDFPLRKGDYIYLGKKKKKADKPYLNHQVKAGESMHSISQRYGIRLKYFYKMNRKNEDFVPEAGDILKLR